MAYHTAIVVLLAVLACVSASTIKSSNTNQTTHESKGVCLVEVPLGVFQICCSGYFNGPEGNCIPTCPIGCLHGVCSSTNTCLCNAGYTLHTNGKVCLPFCRGGCGIGGDCIGPDVCKCKPGFEKTLAGVCQHHCEKGCAGGDCVGPNFCVCRPGYSEKHGVCKANCPRGCLHGDCVGPNRCACKPGWTLHTNGTVCTPTCRDPCMNGVCTAPNHCTCNTGYTKVFTKANVCVAHCPSGCANGICLAPNHCICNLGYTKQGKGSNKCIKRQHRYPFHYNTKAMFYKVYTMF